MFRKILLFVFRTRLLFSVKRNETLAHEAEICSRNHFPCSHTLDMVLIFRLHIGRVFHRFVVDEHIMAVKFVKFVGPHSEIMLGR